MTEGTSPGIRPGPAEGRRRPVWLPLVVIALAIGTAAAVGSAVTGEPIADPEGSFLGPSWVRLPVLCGAAVLADLLPRALWVGRLHPGRTRAAVRERLTTHWTRERLQLVVVGISCFYVVYVSYRNLKSLLPVIRSEKYDRELHLLDRALFFGNDPAPVLHDLLGTNIAAHLLSSVYLAYIPLVAILVTIWLVWSRNTGFGWWFVTSQGIAWTLGVLCYYALPTVGPGLAYPPLVADLAHTGTTDLMDSLVNARHGFLWGEHDHQGVAGFASLHTAISLLWALMVQHTVRHRGLRILFWVNFFATVVATLYFGWHYVADDIGGVAIAVVAFYLGARWTGNDVGRKHGLDPPEVEPGSRRQVQDEPAA
ncbi:phosphatase PAP2 family protein [Nocardioides sp. cx-169]|uniref:phosphatase PAP2 family protein n=1 Tax=Nocardioides sp. cx-169 TaxID=2899080 RepID=UPI001E3284B8|nr:phosphatase PAP2 family protein [Nocardioides sp. cx-169]MCD4532877.1 phosphatase PAP2 family protein [Nocardioides sp. cx-169]